MQFWFVGPFAVGGLASKEAFDELAAKICEIAKQPAQGDPRLDSVTGGMLRKPQPKCPPLSFIYPFADFRRFGYVDVPPDAAQSIVQAFNNAKWKGDKLRVEVAQPTYDTRLEQEKEEAAAEMAELASAAAVPSAAAVELPASLALRSEPGAPLQTIKLEPLRVSWAAAARMAVLIQELLAPELSTSGSFAPSSGTASSGTGSAGE